MNLCLFFEGTGQGVAGRFTNVTRLYDVTLEDARQKRRLEAGPGTHVGAYLRGRLHGHDWWIVFRSARRWFEKQAREPAATAEPLNVFLFGFSRGALIARRFAAWLDNLGIAVAYLGLWDTVDATLGVDVSEFCPPNVRAARHAVARDETRRLYAYVPLKKAPEFPDRPVEELVFPGSHSDVGGLYDDNHVIADAALIWIADGARQAGLLIDEKSLPTLPADAGKKAVRHDPSEEASNLWGALGRVRRMLKNLKIHPIWEKDRQEAM